ncbi:MAG: hypothetical protein IKU08_06630 [Clostridia bacterium]|nr:hypothetical protein [Clostridia bacterium]
MQVSARILGREFGLTAEEMNRVLLKQGYYVKSVIGYEITEKAVDYVVEKGHHSGPGGYSRYNADWVTRTFDESIKDVLQVTPELIKEVRAELSSERAIRYAKLVAERAKADADFIAKQTTENIPPITQATFFNLDEETIQKLKRAGIAGIVIGGTVALGYGIYKLTPKIKVWWNNRMHNNETDKVVENQKETDNTN